MSEPQSNDELRKRLVETVSEAHDDADAQLSSISAENETLRAELARLQASHGDLIDERAGMMAEARALRNEADALRAERDELQTTVDEAIQRMHEQAATMTQRHENVMQHLGDTQRLTEAVVRERDALRQRVGELETE